MPRAPKLKAPPGACDCHLHIYGESARYPWVPVRNRPFPDRRLEHYIEVRDRLGLARTVIVQPTHYATDNRCLLDSVAGLGGTGRGIAVVDPKISDTDLAALHAGGIRGLRFGIDLANGMQPDVLEDMAARIAPFGWHIQYRCWPDELLDLEARFRRLPVPVCFDHMGNISPDIGGADHPAFKALLRLLDAGNAWVKLSAPYQLSKTGAPGYVDYLPQGRAFVKAAPERMVWGTNWPHPRVSDKPDEADLLDVLRDWTGGDAKTLQAILVDNPARLYGFV
jgi:predicted TIM-barrel fold metal-dependent hydrolase